MCPIAFLKMEKKSSILKVLYNVDGMFESSVIST